ncbi:MAG: hypothetical protein ABIP88_04010, partial [Candidatus Binatia bacterium]
MNLSKRLRKAISRMRHASAGAVIHMIFTIVVDIEESWRTTAANQSSSIILYRLAVPPALL